MFIDSLPLPESVLAPAVVRLPCILDATSTLEALIVLDTHHIKNLLFKCKRDRLARASRTSCCPVLDTCVYPRRECAGFTAVGYFPWHAFLLDGT
eukprot:5968293-Pleurochrysis_carterae.AAC.2